MTSLAHERRLQAAGYRRILGMDEAGRGAWAGPVCVGAVCLPPGRKGLAKALAAVRDSKAMTPANRVRAASRIRQFALAWGLGCASNAEIDGKGIEAATELAMQRALDDACQRRPGFRPDCLLLDAIVWPGQVARYPQVTMIDGDARSLSIAAASVLAKTWRDDIMRAHARAWPGYGLERHKGYGTDAHRAALKALGPCPLHRHSYRPLAAHANGRAR